MSEERHRAIVRISYEFLRNMLFPENTVILAVMNDAQDIFGRKDFVCVIEHPDLPVSIPGELLPSITPTYHREFHGFPKEIPIVTFEDWGI